jgi:hypothetical protein
MYFPALLEVSVELMAANGYISKFALTSFCFRQLVHHSLEMLPLDQLLLNLSLPLTLVHQGQQYLAFQFSNQNVTKSIS